MGSQSVGTTEGYTAQTSSYLSDTMESTPFAATRSSLEPGNKAGRMLSLYSFSTLSFSHVSCRAYLQTERKDRMGKTTDLFKKITDTKGTFHAKMGSIKDRNGMDLTEAEDIKKRWQEYTEELYKKDLHDPDDHDGVITHLEPDILECEVKWALESITMNKTSGGDGIPVELFQILKDDAVKVLHSICQ